MTRLRCPLVIALGLEVGRLYRIRTLEGPAEFTYAGGNRWTRPASGYSYWYHPSRGVRDAGAENQPTSYLWAHPFFRGAAFARHGWDDPDAGRHLRRCG